MKLGRNIAPFLISVVAAFNICAPTFSAVPCPVLSSTPILQSTTHLALVSNERKTFRHAVTLYDSGMYERAAELFASLAGVGAIAWDNGAVGAGDAFDAPANGLEALEIDFDGAMDIEALGYYVLCAVKMQTRGYTVLANSYILKYPYGSLVPQIRFAHATICFDMGDYKGADSQLESLSRRKLYHPQVPSYLFMRAFCSLELGEDNAKERFMDVINYKKSNHYIISAHYFLGYIYYTEGELSEAREHFALAATDPQFKSLAERYLAENGGVVSQSTGISGVTSQNLTGTSATQTTTSTSTSQTTGGYNVTGTQTYATSTTEETATAAAATVETTAATTTVATAAESAAENAAAGETAYLLILNSYNKGDFDDVEDRVLDFAESDSPNQYWLAKAFIVLGDSYAEQGDFAKALTTFESVRDGYNPSEPDDVKDELDVRIRRAQEMLNKKK